MNIQINLGIIGVSIILSSLIGIVTILSLLCYTNLYQNRHKSPLIQIIKNPNNFKISSIMYSRKLIFF